MWQRELILLSCCCSHSSSSTMFYVCSINYNNNGHVTTNQCLFGDLSWITMYSGEVRSLSRQKLLYAMWIHSQKCMLWFRWGIQNLVPSKEQLWRTRRSTAEADEHPNKNLSGEHHQREKHQQLHLVAGERCPRKETTTCHKWVKHKTHLLLLHLYWLVIPLKQALSVLDFHRLYKYGPRQLSNENSPECLRKKLQ